MSGLPAGLAAGLLPATRCRVLERRQLDASTHLLALRGGVRFLPGQNVNLALSPGGPARSYSLASAPADPALEVLFDVLPGGQLTPRLAALAPGDPLFVSPAFGGFLDDGSPATWIAAGTGVAPFASMVRAGLGEERILVQAARSPAGLHFRELFAARLGARYFPCCPGPEAVEGARPGGLRAWLRDSELPPDRRYLLCGSASLVVAVRELLLARGVPLARILAEIYF